jgi:hypothetical protein
MIETGLTSEDVAAGMAAISSGSSGRVAGKEQFNDSVFLPFRKKQSRD